MSDAAPSHQMFNPPTLSPGVGFSHAVVAAAGRTVYVAGEIGCDTAGVVVGETLAEQFDLALANVVAALAAAGARPAHVVSITMYCTRVPEYRSSLREIGRSYRTHFGRHFPAMALVGVTELVEPMAKIEIMATAVIPGPA